MFAYIKGILEVKTKGYIVIENNCIGYKVFMSESAIEILPEIGKTIKVHTYYKVREDDISIFGFNTNEELRLFELLLSVSGVGAKVAINILSNISPSSFALAIITDNVDTLKKLPGIGVKSAQRLVLELKDKLKTQDSMDQVSIDNMENIQVEENSKEKVAEAISALQVLGYSKKEINDALENVDIKELSIEDIIRKGLKNLAR